MTPKSPLTLLSLLLLAVPALAQRGNPGGAINDRLGAMDYGVCRGTDPACYHDWARTAPAVPRVLLVTRTAGPRHANLGPALGAGLNPPLADGNVVQRGMRQLLERNGLQLDYTEDLAELQAPRLNRYSAIIFFSTSREALDDGAKTALRQYLRAGGGFVGIHNALGTHYNWPYYEGLLGGTNFYDHGPLRAGDVVMIDRKDASTRALPARWRTIDEWYNLVPFPTQVRFLATVDEKSWGPAEYTGPARGGGPPGGNVSVVGQHPGHGAFHPVAWCQYYDGGKAWITSLGHDARVFDADNRQFAGAVEFQQLVIGGIRSVIGLEAFCR